MTENQRPAHCQQDGCGRAFALDERGQPQYKTLPVIEAGKVRSMYLCPDCWQAWRDGIRAKFARTAAVAAASLLLAATIGTGSAHAQTFRPPRQPATPTATATAPDTSSPAPRLIPRGRPCENNRRYTPRSCDPERRPLDRRVPR